MITISPEQKKYIDSAILDTYHSLSEEEQKVLEDSEDYGDARIIELRLQNFKRLSSSEEFHYLMQNWNWDDGLQIPKLIVDHPLCDKGTALMIYWMLDPDYCSEYESEEDVPDYHQEDYHLLKDLEQRLLNNKYTSAKIKFLPSSYASAPEIENPLIPEQLKVASEGEEFEKLIAFA